MKLIALAVLLLGMQSLLADDLTPAERAEYEKTVSVYSSGVIPQNPKDAHGYEVRGYAYLRLGQLDRALDDYSQAIHFAPNFASHYLNRASVYTAQGDNEKALQDCNEAIRLNPNQSGAYLQRGDVYWNLKQHPESGADYLHAAQLDPRNAAACHAVAWYLIHSPDPKVRNPAQAVQWAQRASALSGGKVERFEKTLKLAQEKLARGGGGDPKTGEADSKKPAQ